MAVKLLTFIRIAADSLKTLRKSDVFRVLDECPYKHREALATYIKEGRVDLVDEVDEAMTELNEA